MAGVDSDCIVDKISVGSFSYSVEICLLAMVPQKRISQSYVFGLELLSIKLTVSEQHLSMNFNRHIVSIIKYCNGSTLHITINKNIFSLNEIVPLNLWHNVLFGSAKSVPADDAKVENFYKEEQQTILNGENNY